MQHGEVVVHVVAREADIVATEPEHEGNDERDRRSDPPDGLAVPVQMAGDHEIDQPCLRNAVASMSSFPVNMREVPLHEVLAWTPTAPEGGPLSVVDRQSTGDQVWRALLILIT
jgi:hypothetical protein